MGGHCLPVDPFYLAWRAREFDQPTEFIELAGEVNQRMPYFCVEKIAHALNDHAKPVRGIADRDRRRVVQGRRRGHARVARAEDHAPAARAGRGASSTTTTTCAELPDFGLSSEPLDVLLEGADCAVIVTAHPDLDVERIVREAPLVVDFRGVTRGIEAPNLVRL